MFHILHLRSARVVTSQMTSFHRVAFLPAPAQLPQLTFLSSLARPTSNRFHPPSFLALNLVSPLHDQVPPLVVPHVPWKKTCGLSEPRRSPPQVHAISQGSLFHVACIVRGPSRVGSRSEPGLSWEYLSPCIASIRPPSSFVPLFPFCIRLSAQDFSF